MPAVNDVGKPCAGEPHARFDGRELETDPRKATAMEKNTQPGNRSGTAAPCPTADQQASRQLPTLHPGLDMLAGKGFGDHRLVITGW